MDGDFKNMRIKLFEEFGNSRQISIDIDAGNVFGVLHNRRDNFENWIVKERLDDEARGFFAMFPDKKLLPIAILKNLNVPSTYRGQGVGNDLMSAFLNDASDAKNVVLIADTAESNDFNIIEWYRGWGFIQIGSAGGNPVMVLNNY